MHRFGSICCGLLHTLTPEAKPIPHEKPRLICYTFGDTSAEGVQKTIDLSGKSDRFVAVRIDDLLKAWKLGMLRFFEEIEKDLVMKLRVYTKAKKFFSRISSDEVNQALARLEKKA